MRLIFQDLTVRYFFLAISFSFLIAQAPAMASGLILPEQGQPGIGTATVGLGPAIDEQLLFDIASGPDLYFRAPNAEDLLDLYRQIARLIPCR